ncbi:hypothetical protein CSAL01_09635 [Colletotrichum salicis]|uniref:C3H1-type domain-containing protein n=1 Tax=Colletotrichum salicis TaxID=1209931 RepID=A0A135SWD5_9PEZI|nr:hypothetical protein CSAL01_09635 [Colletotrichum salicis]
MDRDNHDKASSSKKQKKICQSRMPKARRDTCRHFLDARCNYGRDACNFPHREDELPAHLVEAAHRLEEEIQARARRTPVFYNNNNNGNITYHHGDYVSHGDYANSSSNGAYNQAAPSRYMGYYTQTPLPNTSARPSLEGPNQQAIAYHTAQIANPMLNTLGPVNFDGTRGQHSSYYSPPPAYVPAQPVPLPAYAPPGPYGPQHIVHRQGYAGPSLPGPPPYYPAGANWGPPLFHHHHPHLPPPGFAPYWDPSPAAPPGFESGQGYGLPLPPLPANPEHWPADAAAAASPKQALVPNTAPASVTDSKEDHSTTRCWHGRNCKKPGCHYLHDGNVNPSSNGNGNDNGNGEGSSSGGGGGGANKPLDNYIQDAIDNGPENGGIDLGDGNDDSASWAGDVARPPSPSEQSSEEATPQSSPRQLPASVAGDVTPPTLEHTSEEHSEEEADAELSTIEEDTSKAHSEEEHSEDEEGELCTMEQQTPETPSKEENSQEEVDIPAPVEETHEEETPAQPPARRGPLVVDGRSGWGLRKVKGKQRAV